MIYLDWIEKYPDRRILSLLKELTLFTIKNNKICSRAHFNLFIKLTHTLDLNHAFSFLSFC